MALDQIPISKGEKVILDTIKDELLPAVDSLKDILVRIHKVRISYQLYSSKLIGLESEYIEVSASFFDIVRKLQTPNILFDGLDNESQNMVGYFKYQGAFQKNIEQGLSYVEIVDRTLDRKLQSIQNNRTFLISIAAIIISILSLFWAPNFEKIISQSKCFESGNHIKQDNPAWF